MNPDTLEALRESIAKWDQIAAGKERSAGMDNCPLCEKFALHVSRFNRCRGCPVANAGHPVCKGSPYDDFVNVSDDGYATTKAAKEAAQRTAAFLRSLLPAAEVVTSDG